MELERRNHGLLRLCRTAAGRKSATAASLSQSAEAAEIFQNSVTNEILPCIRERKIKTSPPQGGWEQGEKRNDRGKIFDDQEPDSTADGAGRLL